MKAEDKLRALSTLSPGILELVDYAVSEAQYGLLEEDRVLSVMADTNTHTWDAGIEEYEVVVVKDGIDIHASGWIDGEQDEDKMYTPTGGDIKAILHIREDRIYWEVTEFELDWDKFSE